MCEKSNVFYFLTIYSPIPLSPHLLLTLSLPPHTPLPPPPPHPSPPSIHSTSVHLSPTFLLPFITPPSSLSLSPSPTSILSFTISLVVAIQNHEIKHQELTSHVVEELPWWPKILLRYYAVFVCTADNIIDRRYRVLLQMKHLIMNVPIVRFHRPVLLLCIITITALYRYTDDKLVTLSFSMSTYYYYWRFQWAIEKATSNL